MVERENKDRNVKEGEDCECQPESVVVGKGESHAHLIEEDIGEKADISLNGHFEEAGKEGVWPQQNANPILADDIEDFVHDQAEQAHLGEGEHQEGYG